MDGTLRGKTLFITGASRGIGLAIALRAARDGAAVVIAAKTVEPHPKLPGTIFSAAADVEAAGGRALAVACDVRDADQVARAVDAGIAAFGGIDIVVNNAGAIRLTGLADTPVSAFDLLMNVNVRAAYITAAAALPHLLRASNPHVLTLAPPLLVHTVWLGRAPAYTLSKFGMTLIALAIAEAHRADGIASNTLWPKTTIATSAVRNLRGGEAAIAASRTPDIVADAAYAILTRSARECTGHCFIDEEVLRDTGVTDFAPYAVQAGHPLRPDIFLDA